LLISNPFDTLQITTQLYRLNEQKSLRQSAVRRLYIKTGLY